MIQAQLPGTERYLRLNAGELLMLGVSRWQIGEWHRRGIIMAPLSKTSHRGAPGHSCDVVEASVISALGQLRRAPYRLDTLRAAAPAVRRHFRERGGAAGWLVTDGVRTWIDTDLHVLRISAGLGRNAIVDLAQHWKRCVEMLSGNPE